jgi:hypothetical protein
MVEYTEHGGSQPVEYTTVGCEGSRLKITKNGFDFLAYAHGHGLFSSTRSGISSPELPAAFRDGFHSGPSQASKTDEGLDEFPGYFWMDAICINQEDVKERSAQVSLMGDIYRSSRATLVWMGNEDPPPEACWVMQSLIPRFLSVWYAVPDPISFFETKDAFFRDPEVAELLGEGIAARWQTDWKGFYVFITRVRWFSRGWVVQEAVLGSLARSRNVVVLCGSLSIPWHDLANFLAMFTWCDWKRLLSKALAEDRETMRLVPAFSTALQRINCSIFVQDIVSSTELVMPWFMRADYGLVFGKVKMYCIMYALVRYIRLHVFTDPRDTIYGCLGLVTTSNPGISCPIKADYTLSVSEVLTAASWQMLSNMPRLDLLNLRESEEDRVRHDLPSWVPDLSAQSWSTTMHNTRQDLRPYDTTFDASGSESPCSEFAFTGGRTLTLIGATVSVVHEMGPTLKLDRRESIEFEWFLQLLISRQAGFSSPYPANDEALCRTLVADTLPDYMSEMDYARTFQVWWATHLALRSRHIEREGATNSKTTASVENLVNQLQQHASSWLPTTSDIIAMKGQLDAGASCPPTHVDTSIAWVWYPRVFICTDDGRFGLANPGAQVGDEVWILKGGRTPFLLRRHRDGNYQLVGEAFVHGIMFGEILTPEFEERFGAVSLS